MGIYEPDGHDGPVYLIEFQAQNAHATWYNLLSKMGLYLNTREGRQLFNCLTVLYWKVIYRLKNFDCCKPGSPYMKMS